MPEMRRFTNAGSEIQVREFRFANAGSEIQVREFRFANAGSEIQVRECRFANSGSQMQVRKFRFTKAGLSLMQIMIPSPLRSYTKNQHQVEAEGSTLCELLADLDLRYPGIRFRMIDEQDCIRQHIKIYVDRELVSTIKTPLSGGETIHIICALSGG